MVDFQHIEYVTKNAVHQRIARRLARSGIPFQCSHGTYLIDKGDRLVGIDCEELARLLGVLRWYERVEDHWAGLVRNAIEEQRPS